MAERDQVRTTSGTGMKQHVLAVRSERSNVNA